MPLQEAEEESLRCDRRSLSLTAYRIPVSHIALFHTCRLQLLTSRPWILSGSSDRALLRIEITAPFLTLLSPVASADFVEQSACGAESGLMKSNSLEAVNPLVQRVSTLPSIRCHVWDLGDHLDPYEDLDQMKQ